MCRKQRKRECIHRLELDGDQRVEDSSVGQYISVNVTVIAVYTDTASTRACVCACACVSLKRFFSVYVESNYNGNM